MHTLTLSKAPLRAPSDGRVRVAIERVSPEVDCGRFPIKRVSGDRLIVEADVFADGHDEISAQLLYRHEGQEEWQSAAMERGLNDRWRGEFAVSEIGRYYYTVAAWINRFQTWLRDLVRRQDTGPDLDLALLAGAALIEEAARSATAEDAEMLRAHARALRDAGRTQEDAVAAAAGAAALVYQYGSRDHMARYERELIVVVDRQKARFSTWYEVFPRSCAPEPGKHGTLADCERWLPYIASMGFDVLYLPPFHPIGRAFRKARNNVPQAGPDDVGSPWAIGAEEGGHTAVHPLLGTLADFDHLLETAGQMGIEVALDLAFQCSPDHPYVRQHPEWFRKRPDGTIQYAENPPKKYQDIYPLDFESQDWQALWEELRRVVLFWIDRGARIFRVDNPHTKAFSFWEWLIADVKSSYPDVLFLAEAFTRPSVMKRLAKLGFSGSYTYFTWRNTKEELTRYFQELTETEAAEYFRAHLWPNTPDILPEALQTGRRPAFMVRLILAATLSGNYGIYGPAFELCENEPREPGSEEYLNSEKYELKYRDPNAPGSLREFIARINRIRKDNPALQVGQNLYFHDTDNPSVLCYSRATADLSNVVLVIVNLDPFHTQRGWVTLNLSQLGVDSGHVFQAHDMLGAGRYLWQGPRAYFELVPESLPAHIVRLRRWLRTEQQFDYYL